MVGVPTNGVLTGSISKGAEVSCGSRLSKLRMSVDGDCSNAVTVRVGSKNSAPTFKKGIIDECNQTVTIVDDCDDMPGEDSGPSMI